MHTCELQNTCLPTNPQNIPVITGYERSEDAGATQEKKQALRKQVDCNQRDGEERKGRRGRGEERKKQSKVAGDKLLSLLWNFSREARSK